MTTEHRTATPRGRPAKETATFLLQNSSPTTADSSQSTGMKPQTSQIVDPKTQGIPSGSLHIHSPLTLMQETKSENLGSSRGPSSLSSPDSKSHSKLDLKSSGQDKKRPEGLPIEIVHSRKIGHLRFSNESKEEGSTSSKQF